MASSLIIKALPIGVGLMYAEINLLPAHLIEVLTQPSSLIASVTLPKGFGLVIIVNVILSGLTMVGLGMKVGKARGHFKDKVGLIKNRV